MALVCQYFDTALLLSLPHLHVADGISGERKHLMNHPSCDNVHSNNFAAS
jgi:hypothetical protein